MKVLQGMAGMNGVMLHKSLRKIHFLQGLGIKFGLWLDDINGNDHTYLMVIIAMLVTAFSLNSIQIVERVKPSWRWMICMLIISFWSLLDMNRVSEFLYFQF